MDRSKTHFKTIDEYVESFPTDVQKILQELRKIIRDEIPGVEETIHYSMPTFNYNGKYVIYFAAWKKHISLYPFSSEMEKDFPESSDYTISGKGTIQFPLNKPLPMKLIRDIVLFRLKQVS